MKLLKKLLSFRTRNHETDQAEDSTGSEMEQYLQQEIEHLEAENEELLLLAQEENEQLKKAIEDLQKQNESLQEENRKLLSEDPHRLHDAILYYGTEQEFYTGETREFILETLKRSLNNIPKGTRRYDVVSNVIESNGQSGILEEKRAEIKHIFRQGKNISRHLQHMGFKVAAVGKHYKCTYYGDSRYMVTLSCTPGDCRTDMNEAMITINTVL